MVLVSGGKYLVKGNFLYSEEDILAYDDAITKDDDVLLTAAQQLKEYFAGVRLEFALPIKIAGTDFQERVWQTLKTISYGEVLTYKQIAIAVGSSKAFRAVGGACRANPIAVIIPCHRVLGSNGAYTGFSGDKTYMKEALLKMEAGQGFLNLK